MLIAKYTEPWNVGNFSFRSNPSQDWARQRLLTKLGKHLCAMPSLSTSEFEFGLKNEGKAVITHNAQDGIKIQCTIGDYTFTVEGSSGQDVIYYKSIHFENKLHLAPVYDLVFDESKPSSTAETALPLSFHQLIPIPEEAQEYSWSFLQQAILHFYWGSGDLYYTGTLVEPTIESLSNGQYKASYGFEMPYGHLAKAIHTVSFEWEECTFGYLYACEADCLGTSLLWKGGMPLQMAKEWDIESYSQEFLVEKELELIQDLYSVDHKVHAHRLHMYQVYSDLQKFEAKNDFRTLLQRAQKEPFFEMLDTLEPFLDEEGAVDEDILNRSNGLWVPFSYNAEKSTLIGFYIMCLRNKIFYLNEPPLTDAAIWDIVYDVHVRYHQLGQREWTIWLIPEYEQIVQAIRGL